MSDYRNSDITWDKRQLTGLAMLSNTFGIRIPLLGMEPDALDNNDSKAFRIMDPRKTK